MRHLFGLRTLGVEVSVAIAPRNLLDVSSYKVYRTRGELAIFLGPLEVEICRVRSNTD